ncbi:SDR family oxidoreductase [Rhizosphaericola mali]|uniref:SDR family oxidoreductase n=1 Tax=Rhizosphaericola mali TaxID=2545455 RepID=A0A5P2G2J6_9BACT|nr:SDR family oxidoreductase [Rhizosphaericola mali]QES88938.1 SDR family oxidoreductase [Rhizosphaericola mali]
MQNLKGLVVVITGASAGIGETIALELANQKVKVVLGARSADKLAQIVDKITSNGGDAIYFPTDVTKKNEVKNLVNEAVEHYGKLDVVINNAGVAQIGKMEELDVEFWDQMIDINIKGTLYGMAAAIPVFKRQNYGHIINIISTAGIKIVPTQAVYAGTKNAIRTITEAFRQESDGSIKITGISPGFVHTEFGVKSAKTLEMKKLYAAKVEEIAISPKAIADAVIYAISQPKEVEIGDIVIRPAAQN